MAYTSEGITLARKIAGEGTDFIPLENLQDIPELGGSKEAIEITCLADHARKYTDGIANYGDSIPFTFLYDSKQFEDLEASTETDQWKVTLPDGKACTFGGKGTVKLNGVGVNGALTYTLSVRPNTELAWGKKA